MYVWVHIIIIKKIRTGVSKLEITDYKLISIYLIETEHQVPDKASIQSVIRWWTLLRTYPWATKLSRHWASAKKKRVDRIRSLKMRTLPSNNN